MPGRPSGITDAQVRELNRRFTDPFLEALLRGTPRALAAQERLLNVMARGARPFPRALEALRLASHGLTRDEIAEAMGIGRDSVNEHLHQMRLRLGARNTSHAVAIALTEGIIQ